MKIICDKENLKKGFRIVESVISSSSINSILQNVKITTKKDSLELSTTDLEVSISYIVESVKVIEPGVILLPAAKISSIVKEWTEEEIKISENNRVCQVTGEDSSFKILCADTEEFPTIPIFTENGYIEIENNVLADMIKKTVFIVMSERLQNNTNGLFFDIEGQQSKMVTNDGRRLVEIKRKVNNPKALKINCVLPVKGAMHILKVVSEKEGISKVKIDKKRISIKTKNSTVYSQLIEEKYVDYETVIPVNLDKKVILNRKVFYSAVRRSAIVTTEDYKCLRFKFSEGKLELFCISPDVGESKVEIPIEYSGKEVEVALNPDYIIDFLKTIEAESIEFNLADHKTAIFLSCAAIFMNTSKKPVGAFSVKHDYIYVLMPMDLQKA